MKRYVKIVLVSTALLAVILGGVLLREYLMLRQIQATIMAAPKSTGKDTPVKINPAGDLYVHQVKFGAGQVEARARFSAFKKTVEANPRLVAEWGTLRWKILGDIPALCIRSLGAVTPFTPLGVTSGDCITHIDGETVNQPLRNLAIWMTLGSRSSIRIDTLRAGKKISYHLVRI